MPNLKDDLEETFEPIIRVLQSAIKATIEAHLVQAFIKGDRELVTWGQTLGGIPISYEGSPIDQAISWAQKHCATLVTKMDDETKARLAQVVSEAIENKSGIPGLARDIRNEFDNMTKFRSQLIARSETRNALFHASQERMEAMGVTGKEWVPTSDACDICLANADVGAIPVDQEFPTPQYEIHPGCRCSIAPVMLGRE